VVTPATRAVVSVRFPFSDLSRTKANTELNGHKTQRLANTSNITFHGIESEALLILLGKEDICASSGSACLADSDEPSHVIRAMKPDSTASQQLVRFSLDIQTRLMYRICADANQTPFALSVA
jgi:cysteine sulfinate desulfinase/cysteine desulfurase-like protein